MSIVAINDDAYGCDHENSKRNEPRKKKHIHSIQAVAQTKDITA